MPDPYLTNNNLQQLIEVLIEVLLGNMSFEKILCDKRKNDFIYRVVNS